MEIGKKSKVLIADDSDMNRELLSSMLEKEYETVHAENGKQAIEIMRGHLDSFSILLLDLQMPEMDGFEVLDYMNKHNWIEEIPVIIISSQVSPEQIERCYELGAVDYIHRPFNEILVRHRISNTIILTANQRMLSDIIVEQLRNKRKDDRQLISILAQIVEFRNGESGMHVIHIMQYTELFLRHLSEISEKYKFTENDISLISTVSALHDIGKIAIPDGILNKPGKLTPEEFDMMKEHTTAGAKMIESLPYAMDDPLLKTAYHVIRWHHERYDGKGYPDGLVGDDIPMCAQAVSLADVYDALTSERCYKKAYPHEMAVQMILDGQCGSFNPILLRCLEDLDTQLKEANYADSVEEIKIDESLINRNTVMKQINDGTLMPGTSSRAVNYTEEVLNFLSGTSKNDFFYYNFDTKLLVLSRHFAADYDLSPEISDPINNHSLLQLIGKQALTDISETFKNSNPEMKNFETDFSISSLDHSIEYRCICRTIWTNDKSKLIGIAGRLEKK